MKTIGKYTSVFALYVDCYMFSLVIWHIVEVYVNSSNSSKPFTKQKSIWRLLL